MNTLGEKIIFSFIVKFI